MCVSSVYDSLCVLLQRNLTCALDSSSDVFVVADETRRVGEYERQLTSTLLLCRVTEFTAGLYECAVNQTRLDNVTKVWSANVQTAKQEASKLCSVDGRILRWQLIALSFSFMPISNERTTKKHL